jgi:hypothetical protein
MCSIVGTFPRAPMSQLRSSTGITGSRQVDHQPGACISSNSSALTASETCFVSQLLQSLMQSSQSLCTNASRSARNRRARPGPFSRADFELLRFVEPDFADGFSLDFQRAAAACFAMALRGSVSFPARAFPHFWVPSLVSRTHENIRGLPSDTSGMSQMAHCERSSPKSRVLIPSW